MVSHPADTLVSLGGQRVARAAAKNRWVREVDALYDAMLFPDEPGETVRIEDMPVSEAEAWKDLVEALTEWGTSHPAKPRPLSDRMNVGE